MFEKALCALVRTCRMVALLPALRCV